MSAAQGVYCVRSGGGGWPQVLRPWLGHRSDHQPGEGEFEPVFRVNSSPVLAYAFGPCGSPKETLLAPGGGRV
jgi:hypothetical protein